MAFTANSASPFAPISMICPKPPRVRPGPALSGRSSFFQKITLSLLLDSSPTRTYSISFSGLSMTKNSR